uniref:Uncharacterized protein n=1 Tax=Arundo donax TaxID=35708 RepID=A0A0A9APV0_ARUDO
MVPTKARKELLVVQQTVLLGFSLCNSYGDYTRIRLS